MCSPALESSNSGRTNITLPAAMRTPAKLASVPAVASRRTISRLVHLKTLLISVQSAGESRVGHAETTTRVRLCAPAAEILEDSGARGRHGRVEAHITVEVALCLLGLGQHFDAPAVRRLEPYTAAEGSPDAEVTLVVPELDASGRGEDFNGLGRREGWRKHEGKE